MITRGVSETNEPRGFECGHTDSPKLRYFKLKGFLFRMPHEAR